MSWFGTIFTSLLNKFKGVFTSAIPTLAASVKAELSSIEDSLIKFASMDLGKLAIDAVNLAKSKGLTGDDAFALAKAQFLADAKTAGHDLNTIGSGIVDWCIQTAYTVVTGVVTQIAKGNSGAQTPSQPQPQPQPQSANQPAN